MSDIIAGLPDSGKKRLDAILELGSDAANAEALMELVETEKGKAKSTAQTALARLDYKPAAPMWKKLAVGKYMGERILMPSCSDCVSDQVAPVILQNLSALFELPAGAKLNSEQFEKLQFSISLMLGKATDSMLDVYRLAAKNSEWFRRMEKEKMYSGDDKPKFWHFNNYIRIWDAAPEELEKIFPAVLTASIVRSKDRRLADLARELFEAHGGAWLLPVFMQAILTKSKEEVYDEFSPYLQDGKTASLLYNALGALYYLDTFKGFEYMLEGEKEGRYASFSWGSYSYGLFDTRFIFSTPVELDERWLFRLAENPGEAKPKVTLQCYNRRAGGVKYEDYDEMLLELLPLYMEDGELKRLLKDYFSQRAKGDDGEITLYRDALTRFSN
ncbi:MAG: hypothetical protein FWG66_10875 [Spirochaetes bacterium]|nr:hypothetical protein [Spirochaetota bacterium]